MSSPLRGRSIFSSLQETMYVTQRILRRSDAIPTATCAAGHLWGQQFYTPPPSQAMVRQAKSGYKGRVCMCLRVCVYRHRFYCRVCWRRLRHPIGAFHKCVCGGGGVKLHALVNNFPPHPQDWTWYPIGSSLLKPCLCSVGVWEVDGWVGDVVWKPPGRWVR